MTAASANQPENSTNHDISLADLLDQCGPGGEDNPVHLPQGWTQGRTAFGGLSTTLAYHAASHIEPDLPPLRSCQVAFTGPLSGELTARTEMLRRGRNTAFVQADIFGEKGLGLHCNFIFAAARETEIRVSEMAKPEFPPIPDDQDLRSGPPQFLLSSPVLRT